jgi:hypothetical protein
MADHDLEALKRRMRKAGAHELYVKTLAANDNSKQQIYLGSNFASLNLLPIGELAPDPIRPRIVKASLDLSWLTEDDLLAPAPDTQLILYPQYPEVRLSGFLEHCERCPSELMRARLAGRLLFLGITRSRKVIACAVGHDSDLAREIAATKLHRDAGVFSRINLEIAADSRAILFAELARISSLGWINSKRLNRSGELVDCVGPNCGGMTLEAELGIQPNSLSEPDFHGWEIKQHKVAQLSRPASGGPITLMTPEPTGGVYVEQGITEFIRRFGYPDRTVGDRLNFGGVHLATKICAKTSLFLTLGGYNQHERKISDLGSGVSLMTADGEAAATWKYTDLLRHWTRKHAQAAYIPSIARKLPTLQYQFGGHIRTGEGTDFLLLIKAIASGDVYYDPGIKIEGASSAHPKVKKRSQFRIRSASLPMLYKKFVEVDLSAVP